MHEAPFADAAQRRALRRTGRAARERRERERER